MDAVFLFQNGTDIHCLPVLAFDAITPTWHASPRRRFQA